MTTLLKKKKKKDTIKWGFSEYGHKVEATA